MRIIVHHDEHGTIQSVAVPVASSSVRTTLQAQPGHHVSEVEAPEVTDERDLEHLRQIKAEYKVEGRGKNARLVKKAR